MIAAIFVAEIGDVHRFTGPDQLACWAGLTTRVDSSDTAPRHGHVSKQGSRLLRWAAIEGCQRAREPYLVQTPGDHRPPRQKRPAHRHRGRRPAPDPGRLLHDARRARPLPDPPPGPDDAPTGPARDEPAHDAACARGRIGMTHHLVVAVDYM